MRNISKRRAVLLLSAMLLAPVSGAVSAQQVDTSANPDQIDVRGMVPTDLTGLEAGPEIEGFISARRGSEMQITAPDGTSTMVAISDSTEVRSKGGFLGLGRNELDSASLLNGIPVTVRTVNWEGGLVANRVQFSDSDLQTAAMIRGATAQRFGEHEVAIEENAAATEALRGRVANIDQYNIRGTTNAYFETGKWQLTPAAEQELCATAAQAQQTDNALLLVVGYTDAVGDQEYNQTLSERRAGRVVNHLQQVCGWEPWRMMTPTGMAEADPLADNATPAGRAQTRRVAVNILVSKALEETGQQTGG